MADVDITGLCIMADGGFVGITVGVLSVESSGSTDLRFDPPQPLVGS